MTPSSVELWRCPWEHSRVPSNGTEARPPPQGIFILPQAVHKTGTGARTRQQEVKSEEEKKIKGDSGSTYEDKIDAAENQQDQIPDGQEGDSQPDSDGSTSKSTSRGPITPRRPKDPAPPPPTSPAGPIRNKQAGVIEEHVPLPSAAAPAAHMY